MVWPPASALFPNSSWTAARADHALHQSSQRETPAVTSWKSTSGTPFATKRGAQCEMAASTRESLSGLLWMTADMVEHTTESLFSRNASPNALIGEPQTVYLNVPLEAVLVP